MAPKQKPGRSKQDYCTPPEFLDALKNKLAIPRFWCDLAASKENAVAEWFYTQEDDALKQDWNAATCNFFVPRFHPGEWAFCNPPYANIRPWAMKAYTESAKGAQIAMLTPASVGANWWADYVQDGAYTLFLNGRLTFTGETTPYPKDSAILLWTKWTAGSNSVWSWRD
jgi:phage N-6-adenine-methyltransferase